MLTGKYKFRQTPLLGHMILQVERIEHYGLEWDDAELDDLIELINRGLLSPMREAHLPGIWKEV